MVVLDKFHYQKSLNYIFKKESFIIEMADSYLRYRMIDEFKQLVNVQCQLFPDQKEDMIKPQKYLLHNINGIINQRNPLYKCPFSMEGYISNKYAKFIISHSMLIL